VIAAAALQGAIHTVLSTDPALLALLGGPHIHDRTPANAAFPYVTFGPAATYDWSTGTEKGDEHLMQLQVWSKQAGKKQALEIAAAIVAALEQAVPVLDGHRLTLLRFAGLDAAYDTALRGFRATLRFEALTEPAI
jgi:Protein of unknown function (DUF3168)